VSDKPEKVVAPSAPKDYDINSNSTFKDMLMLGTCVRQVTKGNFAGLLLVGPTGVGKSHIIENIVIEDGYDYVSMQADGNSIYDQLYETRQQKKVCVWDDANNIFGSEAMLIAFLMALDSRQSPREVNDKRGKGHGRFKIFSRHVIITNLTVLDPELDGFPVALKEMIKPLRSRMLPHSVGYIPGTKKTVDRESIWHYACYAATDGGHLLRDLRDVDNNSLSLEASNEVLMWFADNFHTLKDHNTRILRDVGMLRLTMPGTIWKDKAEADFCLHDPWHYPDGRVAKSIMEPWEIKPTGKTSQHKPKARAKDAAKPKPKLAGGAFFGEDVI
jgi:hypothetical protein